MRKSGRSTIATASRACRAARRRTSATWAIFSRPSATCFGEGLFGDLFGGGRGRGRRARKGGDVQCEVTLDLLEAANGASKVVEFDRHSACETCGGSGAKPGTQAGKMPLLRRQRPSGSGQRLLFAANPLPFLPRQRPRDSRRLPGLPRQRLRAPARQPQGRDSRRRGQRHATPPQRRRRAQHLRRPAGRLLLRDPRQGASPVPSRRPRPGLPGADHLFAGHAWARRSRSPRSTVRSRSTCRPARSPARSLRCAAGACPTCATAAAATCTCRSRSKCPSGFPTATSSCSASWPKSKTPTFRPSERLFREDQGFVPRGREPVRVLI